VENGRCVVVQNVSQGRHVCGIERATSQGAGGTYGCGRYETSCGDGGGGARYLHPAPYSIARYSVLGTTAGDGLVVYGLQWRCAGFFVYIFVADGAEAADGTVLEVVH